MRILRVEHVRDEPVRKVRVVVQHPQRVALRNAQERCRRDRVRRAHAHRLPGQASLPKEIAGAEYGDDGFLPPPGVHK
jgi:hypothetical protein